MARAAAEENAQNLSKDIQLHQYSYVLFTEIKLHYSKAIMKNKLNLPPQKL